MKTDCRKGRVKISGLHHGHILKFPSEDRGRYLVHGQTQEKMNVLWVLETVNEQPTGKIISIYPVENIPKNESLRQ